MDEKRRKKLTPRLQGIIDVDYSQQQNPGAAPPAPPRAKARFRSLMQAGVHASQAGIHPRGATQWWEGGVYENEYIRDGPGGTWRILRLRVSCVACFLSSLSPPYAYQQPPTQANPTPPKK